MSKRKIIIQEKELEDGITKWCALIEYSYFLGLLKSRLAVIHIDGILFVPKGIVENFTSMTPTLFDSENEAFEQAKNCIKFWDLFNKKEIPPKTVYERSYSVENLKMD